MTAKSRLRFGLHTIALFEACKGLVVLLIGLGLLPFLHEDLMDVAERLVLFLHLNPEHRFPGIFLKLVDRAADVDMLWVIIGAFVYSAIRLLEAYGLWKDRTWAEWLAILSGGLYLPVEFYEIFERFSWVKLLIILGNLGIVIYLIVVRFTKLKRNLIEDPPPEF